MCLRISILPFLLIAFLKEVQCSGYMEVEILEVSNYMGVRRDGCCGGGKPQPPLPCKTQCLTFFRLCLKEYQSNVAAGGSCSFGNTSSPILGGNSFTLTNPDETTLRLHFTFRWTRSFTLILQAVDYNNSTSSDSTGIIEEASYSGIILPSPTWHTLNHQGQIANIIYRVRVQCDQHYFNATCTKLCRPRDDKFGHYTCDTNGDKVCINGWKGTNCETAVCKEGCHPVHGKCEKPGDCECRPGWRGELCTQCAPYPGCKHGYCNGSSWQCICDTNWGGILCDQDLNYCGTHEPCENGGTCENTAPDQYLCRCLEGFSGLNCEVIDNPCVTEPCANGGRCIQKAGQFHCVCPNGWAGPTCAVEIDECASAPCQNRATCVDLVGGYECLCPSGWEGSICQYDVDECAKDWCINSYSCQNLAGDYKCKCQKGWSGKNCTLNINDCVGQCQNGATCIDLVNDYHCACEPGFTGRNCATDIDDCQSNPCQNGGECVDQVNNFRCICPVDYMGEFCEIDHDHCTPNPCENGAPCFKTQADYYCHCPQDWQGKNCSIPKIFCSHPPCQVTVDSCVITMPSNSSGGLSLVATGVCGEHGHCYNLPGGGFRCSCEAGYTGKFCHENINDCKRNPCQNGGTCVDKINSFQCICREGWEGDLCTINTDDCNSNPCQHNGTCVDLTADFQCECKSGWKGKTCSLRHGHCDFSTCLNGGTCQDLGHTFLCRCPPFWDGSVCHLAKINVCKSNPCENGGTCVNTGTTYTCICQEGYEGAHCERDINDCLSSPCYNGGKCTDGINWFLCDCAPGFAGPDCRININDCASNPCGAGATCVDNIASFTCLCPPGKTGPLCLQVEEIVFSSGVCEWMGQYLSNNSVWQENCNQCHCIDNIVTCTQVWCGLNNCLQQTNACGHNQVCVPWGREGCLSTGCEGWGECRELISGKLVGPPQVPSPETCWPNQAVLSNSCALLYLTFMTHSLRPGISTETVCKELRSLLATTHAALHSIIVLCEIKTGSNDTVEVTMWSGETSGEGVKEAVRVIGELVSHKQTNANSVLSFALEVKVETALISQRDDDESTTFWNSSSTLILIPSFIIIALIAMLFYWFKMKPQAAVNNTCRRSHEDEKSNNIQNEENFRRYTNPLKEDISGNTVDGSSRVSVVRPLSTLSSEGLELTCEEEKPGPSQVLLFKNQNTCPENDLHKDIDCVRKNLTVVPLVQRTYKDENQVPSDVFTVLV
ncbi:protein jagged-1b isoform X2 [Cimex lectularius]|uniref:Delta-like protein n=1 Tax=Cimex lectularius TaxID=79782 RepID=A0A8I6S3V6_CIMLE|nr:protein jagged-1b isoform X2 [Cimex lectularius]